MARARSWQLVDYRVRPAKSIERKMMIEVAHRLDRLLPVSDMRYVGLGSLYFADFRLVHERLGITDLVSIEMEGNLSKRDRFRANAPYGTRLVFGKTVEKLSGVLAEGREDETHPTCFVWLDYDGTFSEDVRDDLVALVSAAQRTTVLWAVTIQAHPGEPDGRLERFRGTVGPYVPGWADSDAALGGRSYAKGVAHAISRIIELELRDLNEFADDPVLFAPLFNYVYADSKQMATYGGLFHRASLEDQVARCDFANMDEVAPDGDMIHIGVPFLTRGEVLAMRGMVPNRPQMPGLSDDECEAFRRFYRYLPTYAEADL